MKGDHDNLYLLQDGTQADSADCSADKAGVLRHKDGLAVCLRDDGKPMTIGENAVISMNVDAAQAGKMEHVAEKVDLFAETKVTEIEKPAEKKVDTPPPATLGEPH